MLRLFRLSPAELARLISAYRWLLWGRKELGALRGKGWLVGDIERRSAERAPRNRPSDEEIQKMARAIDRAARSPFRWSKCLQNSLALRRWLSTRGVMAELHIGVKKEANGIAAHAWLEYRDEVINDTPDATAQYAPLTRGIREKHTAGLSGLTWK